MNPFHDLRRDLSGEYWGIDTEAIYADGDIGDMNHEGFVLSHSRQLFVDAIVDSDFYDAIQNDVSSYPDEGAFDEIIELLDDEFDLDDVIQNLIANGVDNDIIDAAFERLDLRSYAIITLGWNRIAGNDVQMSGPIDRSRLDELSEQLYNAYDESVLDQQITIEVIIDDNGKYVHELYEIPYMDIENCNGIRKYLVR